MLFPVLTSLRYKKTKKKFNVGNVNLKLVKKYNFIFNSSFNERKIKYNKSYNNDQSVSKVFNKHLLNVKKIIDKKFNKKIKICEIGCGKGYFLNLLEKRYKNIIGFDTTYEGKKKNIFKRYLTHKDKITADLIILRQTLEHIPNHFNFLKMIKKISNTNAYILIEVPDLNWIVKKQAFWDITYEHVNYFSKKTFQNLFKKPEKIKNLFNGQYLLVLTKLSNLNIKYNKKVKPQKISIYKIFPKIKNKIKYIDQQNNGNIYFWGGSTKTLMFLCHCKSNNMLLDKIKFIVDIDFKKQNHYLQIVNKKIISPNKLKKLINPNDLIVVSNSNYIKEVKQTFIKKLKFNIKCISLD